jgi:2-C-methyl-D-erythritol 4-phosphate cytidylyltransferase
MKKYAVIVAGGSGSRMGAPVPKQFLLVHGRPIVAYTLEVFLKAYADLEIILVLPADRMDKEAAMPGGSGGAGEERVRVVTGGATRFHSVQNGLLGLDPDSVIFVHDGVRCLLTTDLIHRCYEQAVRLGSAIPVIDSRDSVRLVTGDKHEALDRRLVKLVQTPQTFLGSVLLPAYSANYEEKFTDEASVVEAAGQRVELIEGENNNIKITGPADLAIAEKILIQGSSEPG